MSPMSPAIDRILEKLNEPQKEAVLHEGGPLVVFAGAGSGKTRVITARIAYLLETGVPPRSIVAMTFTNKAAGEMKERVKLWSPLGEYVPIGTFHSLCARWLREFAKEIGFTADFTIYDDQDSKAVLKSVLTEMQVKIDKGITGDFLSAIGRAKTLGWLPDEAEKQADFFPTMGVAVYRRYQEILSQSNAMDFDDLLMNMLLLLKRNHEIRNLMQARFQHILIDEYQDTNPTQASLIHHLMNEKRNLIVVGDDDQSIYSWRGADPSNILGFGKRYAGTKIIRLEQNYRCTGNIVGAASAMIVNNKKRAEKTLWTQNEAGPHITYHQEFDAAMEAFWVTEQIKAETYKFPHDEVAIFYRTNAQSRQLEDSLRKQNIPYRIYGALRFYDRAEIKDLLAYFRLIINPKDDVAFRRIINVPARGIGKKALELMEELADTRDVPLVDTLPYIAQQQPRLAARLNQLRELLEKLKKSDEKHALSEVLRTVLNATDYLAYIQKKYADSYTDRVGNVHELGTALAEYEQANPEARLRDWLNDVSLSGSEQEYENGVTLMTLHSAKGLEFSRVFIVGVEDGLIPHSHNLEDKEKLEEERRLFYVGLTRAKQRLSLLSAERRRIFTYDMVNGLSRFLKEIPLEFFDPTSRRALDTKPSADFHTKMSLVFHPTYGRGRVTRIESALGVAKAVVDFSRFGVRKVSVTQLRPIEN
ncbi:MAG: UvrD-helicase domain-containing protein [Deltaproteobacteria bacterium]|nr:UvrD-helicase domain-containing protein [Deltaproteobacteria bacterium]